MELSLSLKTFHIFFILVSIALAFGFGVWAVDAYIESSDSTDLTMGILSILVGVALIVYGVKFFRKLGHT